MDLSFDMVKKENFDSSSEGERKVKTEKCDLRVKSEFKSDSNQQSASSKLGGGRLKFFKGKLITCSLFGRELSVAENVR